MTFTGPAIRAVKWGLDPLQWLLCVGIGMLVVLFDLLVKFIPLQRFFRGLGSTELSKEDFQKVSTLAIKKHHDSQFFQRNSLMRSRNSLLGSKQKL